MRDPTTNQVFRSRQRGFTLLELLVTLAVAGLLIAFAVPAMRTFIQNNRQDAEADSLISSLDFARSEAVKRDEDVEVCASTDGATCSNSTTWQTGWIVQTVSNPTVLRVKPALSGGNTLSGAFNSAGVTQVTFQGSGFVKAAAGSQVYHTTYFTLCDSRGATYARDIEVSAVGGVEASSTPGQNLNAKALTCP